MRISLRAVLIALVGLVAIGALVTSGALGTVSKSADSGGNSTAGFCNSSGVSLVIDFGTESQSSTKVTCAEDFSGNGWELFAAAGQSVEGTSEYPVGFVCRINGYPNQKNQPCTSTPTGAQGSWAYYYATAQLGGNWLFSATGASMRKPKCGEADAWVFINPGEDSHEPEIKPVTFKCQH